MRKDEQTPRKLAGSDLLEAIARNDGALAGSACAPEDISEESWISPSIIGVAMRSVEGLVVAVMGALIWMLYVQELTVHSALYFISACAVSALAVPSVFSLGKLYTVNALLRPFENGPRLLLGWTVFFAALTVLVFFSKLGATYSRVWLGSWYVLGFGGILMLRGLVAKLVRGWNTDNRLNRQAVIIGGGPEAAELIEAINATPNIDVSIVGLFDDRDDTRSPAAVAGYRKLGNVDQLVDFARWKRIDLLILALPLSAENRLAELTRKLWILPVDIRLSAYTQKMRFRPRAYSYIGNIPFFDVFDRPLSDWDWVLKSLEDKVITTAALIVLAPIMALIALAVRLDSRGPVLFKQKRYGFNNELIEVYKFRSMFEDQTDHEASKLVTKDDPRVTRVGRWIRATSMDELPQLFNVMKGELSLVGPRPHATQAKAENKLYGDVVEGYFARHRVKPGITGWAQVNGWRGETDTKLKILRRLEHDLYYIENWSVIFDLYILARTPFALFKTEQAY
ncbi:MAG: undecaprenyl-phosphate glucose phosphotransferase [Pseudomonadota bacterium]